MSELPKSYIGLPVHYLSQVFNNTTNSYKFYWFLAILKHLESPHATLVIPTRALAMEMLSSVWYPLDFYKLSFGKQDGFRKLFGIYKRDEKITFTSPLKTISFNHSPSSPTLLKQIEGKLSEDELDLLLDELGKLLLRWVPYRFQRPFFTTELRGTKDSQINKQIVSLAHKRFIEGRGKCLYRYLDNAIEIEKNWADYLRSHIQLLRDFINWHLVQFMQKHNPNAIGISEKLCKPKSRNNDLNTAHKKFWLPFLQAHPQTSCIYTQQSILHIDYAIDHFIPWSYVVHNEIWNLVPVDNSANSSKSNCLPHDSYLNKFMSLQYKAFQYAYQQRESISKVEDFLDSYGQALGNDWAGMAHLSEDRFSDELAQVIRPLLQTAKKMGFETDWQYRIPKP